jgi:predicted DCC family thiol-disulfide oxidoreductase YuxK
LSTRIVYDSECGFCRWSLRKVLAWDRRDQLTPLALQDAEAARLLAAIPERERFASWHLIASDGHVYSAGDAVAPLLRLLPGGRPLAAIAAAFPRLTGRAYFLVARNRSKLGRLVGGRGRARHPR